MAHQLETGFFVRTPAWHRLGIVLNDAPSVADAIMLAGLDWSVEKGKLLTERSDLVKSHRVITRTTDGKILGVVGTAYEPLQNSAAFSFFDPFVASGTCKLEAAGSLREGKRVWILARLNSCEGEVVEGDSVRGYFLLSNSHDGTQAVRAQFTTIRVVCMNTLGRADRRAEIGLDASLRVRHTAKVEAGLTFVQKATDMAGTAFNSTVSEYQRLVTNRLPVDGLRKYVSEVLEVSPEMMRQNQMPHAWPKIQQSYYAGPGSNLPGVFGSYWGAYNAVTDWVDHIRGVKGEDGRLDSAWFGSGARIKERAFCLAAN